MIISIIAAVAKNNVIGYKNKLPWNLPADLKRFKKLTTGHHIIMGRKTHESIGRPLPNRTNIIISENPNYSCHPDCLITHSLDSAVDTARKTNETEIFIIGGSQIYKLTLPLADKIYLTRVKAEFEGDTFFPKLDKSKWKQISCDFHAKDERNPYPYEFCILEKL